MRRSLLVALLLALPAAGCAGVDKSYRDFAAEPTPTLGAAGASVEAEGMIAAFYGKGGGDLGASLPAAVARAPRHGGLREIAAHPALLEGDSHAAFTRFLHAAADRDAPSELRQRRELVDVSKHGSELFASSRPLQWVTKNGSAQGPDAGVQRPQA